ncbi:MAG: inositol monophosphatase family protein [Nanoarchaeota archaeon]
MDKDFNPIKFRQVSEDALVPAAIYIRGAILGDVDLSKYLVKGDKTAVTIVDKESEAISRPIILAGFPELALKQEETKGILGNPNSNLKIYHDPLDGTGGFLMGGATPTIILAAYDALVKEVLACSTMEPSTGRFWFSSKGNGAFLKRFDYQTQRFDSQEGRQIRVNDKEGLKGSHVLVDVDHGFEREALNGEKRQILLPEGRRGLSRSIESSGGKVASFYTNGGHYAYVATGRPTLVGCVTTAIGGPFDVAGLRHVIEAGGIARCYEIVDRKLSSQGYQEQNIESADIVIATNNDRNFNALKEIVGSAATQS